MVAIYPPAARMTDPETSHEAAVAITTSGVRKAQQQLVAALVRKHPGKTSAELAALSTTLDRYQVARRLPEIEGIEVERGPAKRCDTTAGKRRAITWWPK